MQDYELGRLAEELIDKRFTDRIRAYKQRIEELEDEADKLTKELNEEKDKKVYYIKGLNYSSPCIGYGYKYTSVSFDDVTEELKRAHEEVRKLSHERHEAVSKLTTLEIFISSNKLISYLYNRYKNRKPWFY